MILILKVEEVQIAGELQDGIMAGAEGVIEGTDETHVIASDGYILI